MAVRVLFVCLGNICRSPMAEGVFLQRVRDRGLADRFSVESAGTGHWHVGEPPDPRTLAVLRRNGVELDSVARQLQPHDAHRFDWILAMDEDNVRNAGRILGDAGRVRLVMEPAGGGEVPDPYYGGPDGFDRVHALLVGVVDAWIDRMIG